MVPSNDAGPDRDQAVPRARCCGNYREGHDVHFIQVRLSLADGVGKACTIESVSDDGTIALSDGTHLWNHDPSRLRAIISRFGNAVRLGTYGVLRVPHPGGELCFSVREGPDPCRPETAEVREGESFMEEVTRRGGALRSLRSVVEELNATTRGARPTRARRAKPNAGGNGRKRKA